MKVQTLGHPVRGATERPRPGSALPGVAAAGLIVLMGCASAGTAKTITVAAEGGGDYQTIQAAIAAVPDQSARRTIIHIKPGVYQGQIILPRNKSSVSFEGEDAAKTILTFGYNTNEENPPGVNPRFKGAGVVILGARFKASHLTFQNTSGDHGQALALRIDGDRAELTDCRLLGWQDTLMVNEGRQYFRNCYIEGRVDFIYGSGTAIFANCEIHSKNGGYITAASTAADRPFGFVFVNCRLTGDPDPWVDPATGRPAPRSRVSALAYLGRPWRPHASVTCINCQMGDHIRPEGWNNWGHSANEKTARYAEYHSRTLDVRLPDGKTAAGHLVDTSRRAPWSKQLTADEAAHCSIRHILSGTDPRTPPLIRRLP